MTYYIVNNCKIFFLTFCAYSIIINVPTIKSEVITISPRTGRPHLPDSERKAIRLYLRLNESENKMLEELAEKLQLNKTQTILKAIALLAENTK